MSSHSKRKFQTLKGQIKSTMCPNHTSNKAVFVCLTCSEQFACSQCVTLNHQSHTLEDYHSHSEKKKQTLKSSIHNAKENYLASLLTSIKFIDSELGKNKFKSKETKQKIQQRCNELKVEIDRISSKCNRMCDEAEKNNEKKLQKYKDSLQNLYAEYKAQIERCQAVLESGADGEILIVESNFPKKPQVPVQPEIIFPTFQPLYPSSDHYEKGFGTVCNDKENSFTPARAGTEDLLASDYLSRDNTLAQGSLDKHYPQSPMLAKSPRSSRMSTGRSHVHGRTGLTPRQQTKLVKGQLEPEDEYASDILFLQHQLVYKSDVLSEFKLQSDSTSGHAIKTLSPVIAYGQMFVWFWKGRKVYLINRTGLMSHIQPVTLQIKGTVYDVSCVSEMDGKVNLWFCCYEDKSIREVTPSGLRSQKEVTPDGSNKVRFHTDAAPLCLCLTQNKEKVLVGMEGKVSMFTKMGEILHTANDGGLQLEIDPYKIIECPATGHFAILDDNGTITKVDHKLSFQYRFEGKRMTADDISSRITGYKPAKDFYSKGLCFDNDGKILIADFYNQCIILVNNAGHYIQTLVADKTLRPYVINKNNDGTMWVGFEGGTMKLIKYK